MNEEYAKMVSELYNKLQEKRKALDKIRKAKTIIIDALITDNDNRHAVDTVVNNDQSRQKIEEIYTRDVEEIERKIKKLEP